MAVEYVMCCGVLLSRWCCGAVGGVGLIGGVASPVHTDGRTDEWEDTPD